MFRSASPQQPKAATKSYISHCARFFCPCVPAPQCTPNSSRMPAPQRHVARFRSTLSSSKRPVAQCWWTWTRLCGDCGLLAQRPPALLLYTALHQYPPAVRADRSLTTHCGPSIDDAARLREQALRPSLILLAPTPASTSSTQKATILLCPGMCAPLRRTAVTHTILATRGSDNGLTRPSPPPSGPRPLRSITPPPTDPEPTTHTFSYIHSPIASPGRNGTNPLKPWAHADVSSIRTPGPPAACIEPVRGYGTGHLSEGQLEVLLQECRSYRYFLII